jgi:hypothetical protein
VARVLGLAHPMMPVGTNFGDVDNDGWLDLSLGTGDPQLQSLMPIVHAWLRLRGGEAGFTRRERQSFRF